MEPGLDLSGWGAILVGLAAVIGSLASFWMAVKNTKRIERIDKKTEDIDHAVNGKPKGAQTMQSQVADMHADRPAPPPLSPDLSDAAIRDMLRELVADARQRGNR